jgi:hypothetical protein
MWHGEARGSGCWSVDSPCCMLSAKCGSSFSARFLSYGAHAVWFCTLVTIQGAWFKSSLGKKKC